MIFNKFRLINRLQLVTICLLALADSTASQASRKVAIVALGQDQQSALPVAEDYKGPQSVSRMIVPKLCQTKTESMVQTSPQGKGFAELQACLEFAILNGCITPTMCTEATLAFGPFETRSMPPDTPPIYLPAPSSLEPNLNAGMRVFYGDSSSSVILRDLIQLNAKSHKPEYAGQHFVSIGGRCVKYTCYFNRPCDSESLAAAEENAWDDRKREDYVMVGVFDVAYNSNGLHIAMLANSDEIFSPRARDLSFHRAWLMPKKVYSDLFGWNHYGRYAAIVWDEATYDYNQVGLHDEDLHKYFDHTKTKMQFYRRVEILGRVEYQVVEEFDYSPNYWIFTVPSRPEDHLIFDCNTNEFPLANKVCIDYFAIDTDYRSYSKYYKDTKARHGDIGFLATCSPNQASLSKDNQIVCVDASTESIHESGHPMPVHKLVTTDYQYRYLKVDPNIADYYVNFDSGVSDCKYEDSVDPSSGSCKRAAFLDRGDVYGSSVREAIHHNSDVMTRNIVDYADKCDANQIRWINKCLTPQNSFDFSNDVDFVAIFTRNVELEGEEFKMIIDHNHMDEVFVFEADKIPETIKCAHLQVFVEGSCQNVRALRHVAVNGATGHILLPKVGGSFDHSQSSILEKNFKCEMLLEISLDGKCIEIDNTFNQIDLNQLPKQESLAALYAARAESAQDKVVGMIKVSESEAGRKLSIFSSESKYINNCAGERMIQNRETKDCQRISFVTQGMTSEARTFFVAHNYMSDTYIVNFPCGLNQIADPQMECHNVNYNLIETTHDYNPVPVYLQFLRSEAQSFALDGTINLDGAIKVPRALSNISVVYHANQVSEMPLLACDLGRIYRDGKCIAVLYRHDVKLRNSDLRATLFSKNLSEDFVAEPDAPCPIYHVLLQASGENSLSKCVEPNIIEYLPSDHKSIKLFGTLVQTMTEVDSKQISVVGDYWTATEVRIQNEAYPLSCNAGETADDKCDKVYFYEKVLFQSGGALHSLFTPYITKTGTKSSSMACASGHVRSKIGESRCLELKNSFDRPLEENILYDGQFMITSKDEQNNIYEVPVEESNAEFVIVKPHRYNVPTDFCNIGEILKKDKCERINFIRRVDIYTIYTEYPTKQLVTDSFRPCMNEQVYNRETGRCTNLVYAQNDERGIVSDLKSTLILVPIKDDVNINQIQRDVRVSDEYATKYFVLRESQSYLLQLAGCLPNQTVFKAICQDLTYIEEFTRVPRPYTKFHMIPQANAVLPTSYPCPPGFIRFNDVPKIFKNCLSSVDAELPVKRYFPNSHIVKALNNSYNYEELVTLLISFGIATCLFIMLSTFLIVNCATNCR
ncbi:MAG: hypothetical protein MHMPM18_001360 [Marteilia pararefringens]